MDCAPKRPFEEDPGGRPINDGTLAHDGVVDAATLDALRRLRDADLSLLMVTGRELPSLASVFPHLNLFDRVVAENGAVLFDPVGAHHAVAGAVAAAGAASGTRGAGRALFCGPLDRGDRRAARARRPVRDPRPRPRMAT